MTTVVVSGFGPFPPYTDNPSWDALVDAAPRLPAGWRLQRVRLDVAWNRAANTLLDELDDDVRAVIAFGQADDAAIRIERFAVNACDRSLADVDGLRFETDSITADGPAAYTTALPRRHLHDRLAKAGLPVIESHFAGGYLCNFTFYRLMHHLRNRTATPAGFVHVPPIARLPLARTRAAMELVIESVVDYSRVSS